MVTSPALVRELKRVLNYPKLGLTEDDIAPFIADIFSHALVVSPTRKLEIIVDDPDDNRVIECALEAGARWIVSGDKHLLEVSEYEEIRIVNVRKALEIPAE
jgi:putative PIN family toxin of toxin-antitoxin system